MERKNELNIVRLLDAPRERVWQACTEIDGLRQWWGLPTTAAMRTCAVDLRVGGRMHCEIEQKRGARFWFVWNYREIAEGEKLVLEQHYSDEEGHELDAPTQPVSVIVLRLEDAGEKTKLTVTQTGMAYGRYSVEGFEAGWSQSLNRLEEHLARFAAH